MTHGAIIVPVGAAPRHHEFAASLWALLKHRQYPAIYVHQGPDIAANLNHAIVRALEDPKMEWIWFVGDDHVFEPDIIDRLLAHNLPVVAPLVLRRSSPHYTVMLDLEGQTIPVKQGERGLKPVPVVGGAGLLVQRHVFDIVPGPEWYHTRGGERQGEDIAFCLKLNAAGVPIHVDLETHMGHLTTVEIWPALHPESGKWVVSYRNHLSEIVI